MTAPTSKASLEASANQIKNETLHRANTATRVGTHLLNVVDSIPQIIDVSTYGVDAANAGAVNDVGIALAIAAAVAGGSELYWPAVYPSAANLASFHSVRHRGPGGVSRGTDTFYIQPRYSQSNALYVSATGSSGNDGITSSQPFTPSEIAAVLDNYGPMLDGTWTVVHAAATYTRTPQVTLDGLKSANPIVIRGPAVAYAVPTAIYDGTTSTGGVCGIYARNGVRLTVRDMKFQNFASTDAMGVVGDRHCELLCDNVHDTGCDLAGINAESHTRLYVTGGTHSSNVNYNIRAYGQCLVTIGYNSSAHRVTIGDATHAGGSGVLVRDNSSGHIDYCDISGVHDGGGVELINQSRVHLVSCVFGGTGANYYNIECSTGSTFYDDGTNTFNAATSKSIVEWGFSIDLGNNKRVYFDSATHWLRIGAQTDNLSPGAPLHVLESAQSGVTANYNSNVVAALESASPYLGFGGSPTGSAGLMWSRSGDNRRAQFLYDFGSDYAQLRVSSQDTFRWASSFYRPQASGVALGGVANQWSQSWSQQRFYATGLFDSYGTGSPEGVIAAAVGSTYRRLDGATGTSLYIKEANSGYASGWGGK